MRSALLPLLLTACNVTPVLGVYDATRVDVSEDGCELGWSDAPPSLELSPMEDGFNLRMDGAITSCNVDGLGYRCLPYIRTIDEDTDADDTIDLVFRRRRTVRGRFVGVDQFSVEIVETRSCRKGACDERVDGPVDCRSKITLDAAPFVEKDTASEG